MAVEGTKCEARAERSVRCERAFKRCVRLARAVGAFAALTLTLGLTPAAAYASPSYTWSGTSATTENWSASNNWEGDSAPANFEAIGTLTFPRLTSTACTIEEESHPCYFSFNDLAGLSAESLQLDDGDGYLIVSEEPLELGSGGIDASPAGGSSGSAGDLMLAPLRLGAAQRWKIANRPGGGVWENGVLFAGGITGDGDALTVEQSKGSLAVFAEDTEVGPLMLEAPNTNPEYIENGTVILSEGELNASDRQPVNLHNIFFTGTGAVGVLKAQGATVEVGEVEVGKEEQPVGGLEAADVTLDSASGVIFKIMGEGTTPQVNYSQLVAHGSVELGDASLVLVAGPSKEHGPCPTLTPGETFTLISTSGSLSGSFAQAGPEIPVNFAAVCHKSAQTARIEYKRSGTTETVTATVEAAAKEQQEALEKDKLQEEAVAKQHHEEEFLKLLEAHAKQVAEEAVANKEREEQAALIGESQPAAKGGVLAAKEAAPPHAPTRAQLLARALKACAKQKTKKERAQCEARARKKYGSRHKHKSKRR